jgi:hypothetical protein
LRFAGAHERHLETVAGFSAELRAGGPAA